MNIRYFLVGVMNQNLTVFFWQFYTRDTETLPKSTRMHILFEEFLLHCWCLYCLYDLCFWCHKLTRNKSLEFTSNVAFNVFSWDARKEDVGIWGLHYYLHLHRSVCWKLEIMAIFIKHFMMCWASKSLSFGRGFLCIVKYSWVREIFVWYHTSQQTQPLLSIFQSWFHSHSHTYRSPLSRNRNQEPGTRNKEPGTCTRTSNSRED